MNRPSRDHVGTVSVAGWLLTFLGSPPSGGDDEDVGLALGLTGVEERSTSRREKTSDCRRWSRASTSGARRSVQQHPPHRSPGPQCGGKRRRPCCHRPEMFGLESRVVDMANAAGAPSASPGARVRVCTGSRPPCPSRTPSGRLWRSASGSGTVVDVGQTLDAGAVDRTAIQMHGSRAVLLRSRAIPVVRAGTGCRWKSPPGPNRTAVWSAGPPPSRRITMRASRDAGSVSPSRDDCAVS